MSITIIDVAKSANVSKSTAGRVLAGDDYGVSEISRKAVLQAANSLGYVKNSLAKSLRTTKSHTILLIIPDITNGFWAEVARGAQDELDNAGYSLVLANSDWQKSREVRYLEMARSMMVDAVLINAPGLDFTLLEQLSCPVVVLGDRVKELKWPLVGTDTYHAIMESLNYLYERGHRTIAMVHPHGVDGEGVSLIRYQAYKDFHIQHDLPFQEDLIIYAPLTRESGLTIEKSLMHRTERPTALLSGNDLVAVGFLQACQADGFSIPQDISLVGMDDIPASAMTTPRITTVRKPQRRIGQTAARLALDMIEGKSEQGRTLLPATIIERDSVRRLS